MPSSTTGGNSSLTRFLLFNPIQTSFILKSLAVLSHIRPSSMPSSTHHEELSSKGSSTWWWMETCRPRETKTHSFLQSTEKMLAPVSSAKEGASASSSSESNGTVNWTQLHTSPTPAPLTDPNSRRRPTNWTRKSKQSFSPMPPCSI